MLRLCDGDAIKLLLSLLPSMALAAGMVIRSSMAPGS
jgi:hypothetical protein